MSDDPKLPLPDKQSIMIYLTRNFGKVEDVELTKLGSGVHGEGYKVSFRSVGMKKESGVIIKTLLPSDFGHDYMSDRAAVHLLAGKSFSELPAHVECLDIVGYDGRDVVSVKDCQEFYVIMEEAEGREYFRDLKKILSRGGLEEKDKRRADKLARYLVDIHSVKYEGDNPASLYKRKIRDTIGHGECLMGIFDTFSDDWEFVNREDMVEIVRKSITFWDRLKDDHHRLCQVHGDFHPGNIWFHRDDIVLLDRSRGLWGEAADDLFCLLINYLFYALIDRGKFEGPFKELFTRVYERYVNLAWDVDILRAAPLFLAFRVPVIANPNFYPHVDNTTRERLITFAKNILEVEEFKLRNMDDYLRSR